VKCAGLEAKAPATPMMDAMAMRPNFTFFIKEVLMIKTWLLLIQATAFDLISREIFYGDLIF